MKGFTVIDNKTGNYPDCEEITLTEEWAKHLCYCDIDCFAITEDGSLLLMDDCGKCAMCPDDRFTVVTDNNVGGKWISVTESLPERNMQCICRYVFGNNTQAFFQVLDYFATDKQPHFQHELGGSRMRVTHWMPLPEPPKGE